MPWYCRKCGAVNDEGNRYCGSCGAARTEPGSNSNHMPPSMDGGEKVAIFLGNLCFSPLLGIILYFVWKDDKPHKAEEACQLTIYSFVAWIVLSLLFAVAS